MKILLLDNFDSFTFNLHHYLTIAGASVIVKRNNDATLMDDDLFDGVLISPGPGIPQSSGFLMNFIDKYTGNKPMLGVCLGMQAIGINKGWDLVKAHEPRHGKPSLIKHNGKNIFNGLPVPLQVGRYHSLVIQPNNESQTLNIDAECEGEIMAVSDPANDIYAVQFHPESILTPYGQQLINNWVELL